MHSIIYALVVDDLLDGLEAAVLVGQVKVLKGQRERRVIPTHALNRRLQMQKALFLHELD
jgi:hypothetical protein